MTKPRFQVYDTPSFFLGFLLCSLGVLLHLGWIVLDIQWRSCSCLDPNCSNKLE